MGGETSSRTTSSYPRLVERPIGKQIESIYTDRLRAFNSGGQYENQYLRGYVHKKNISDPSPVKTTTLTSLANTGNCTTIDATTTST